MRTTTLSEIRKYAPCESGWKKLLNSLGKTRVDDEPLSFIKILESNGIADAIWCLRVLPDYDLDVMKFKLLCARRVEHLDKTGTAKETLDMVERFINGAATKDELKDAAAYYAAAADAAAYYAAYYAAAADAAAHAHAYAAAYAAAAAAHAHAYAAAYADAAAAEREYQAKIFREIFG